MASQTSNVKQVNAGTRGPTATTFDQNKYDISQYQYPKDLMSDNPVYGSNYVVFYINVAEDSKLIKNGDVTVVEDLTPRDYGNLTTLAASAPTATRGISTAALGIGAGTATQKLTDSLAPNLTIKGVKVAPAAGLLAGAGSAASLQMAANFTGRKQRISTAIALHMPNEMSTKYGINYEETDTALFGAAIGMTHALQQASTIKQGLSDIAAAVNALAMSTPLTAGISKLTGLAPNPRKEQIFHNVDFRTFTFDYQFYPRDPDEAKYIEKLIYEFKLHMHPEFKDAGNFLYIYPSEFDIFYYHGSDENLHVNRHTSCVLTDLTVNYSPQGHFTSFDDGTPTQINISMTFKELSLLTKDKIQAGL